MQFVNLENGMIAAIGHAERPLEQRLDPKDPKTNLVKRAFPFHSKVMTSGSEDCIEMNTELYLIKGWLIINVATGAYYTHRGVGFQRRLDACAQEWELERVDFGARTEPWEW
jgi:hypothetical protein